MTWMRSGYGSVDPNERAVTADAYWEAEAEDYLAKHAGSLGLAELVWCPEGLAEPAAGLLGDVRGLRVLEVGCGGAQCGRWVTDAGGSVAGIDLSAGMLAVARRLNAEWLAGPTATGGPASRRAPALIRADASALPFADATFDVAFTAFGALPFVPSLLAVHQQVARVLRPGGRWVFSTAHPFSWVFPATPKAEDLKVEHSYFDREAYFERADDGHLTYAEFHATLEDHITSLLAAGFTIDRLVEPRWGPDAADGEWADWSAERCALVPSTLIISAHLG